LNSRGGPFNKQVLYRHIKILGWRILKKDIHPHMLRHTRATLDSKLFTDLELMLLFDWKRPDMIRVYSRLSMRDVDDKDLVLHGLARASSSAHRSSEATLMRCRASPRQIKRGIC
jgi:integrase